MQQYQVTENSINEFSVFQTIQCVKALIHPPYKSTCLVCVPSLLVYPVTYIKRSFLSIYFFLFSFSLVVLSVSNPPQIIIYYLDIYYSFFVSLGHYTRSKFSSAYQKPWVAQEQYGRMEWDSYQELCSHSVPK